MVTPRDLNSQVGRLGPRPPTPEEMERGVQRIVDALVSAAPEEREEPLPDGAAELADVFEDIFGCDRRDDALGMAVEVIHKYDLEAEVAAPEERETTCDGSGPFSFAGRLGPFVNVPLAFMEALTSGGDDLVREETIRALLDELRAVLSDAQAEPVGWQRTYHIEHPGEMAAGIWGYSNEVTVTVQRDVGAEDDPEYTFEEHMRHSIAEWFDGAHVCALVPAPTGRDE